VTKVDKNGINYLGDSEGFNCQDLSRGQPVCGWEILDGQGPTADVTIPAGFIVDCY